MENKPNNEISELLARLQQKVEKKSEPKVDSVEPKSEESTEALLSLLKANIGVSEKEQVPTGNEEYDIQGYEFENDEVQEEIAQGNDTSFGDECSKDSELYSKEEEEHLHNRVAELVNDAVEATGFLSFSVSKEEPDISQNSAVAYEVEVSDTETLCDERSCDKEISFTKTEQPETIAPLTAEPIDEHFPKEEVAPDTDNIVLNEEASDIFAENDPDVLNDGIIFETASETIVDSVLEQNMNDAEETLVAFFDDKTAKECLYESSVKSFFGAEAAERVLLSENSNPQAADFDDVDINLALALGSREELESSVGYVRVRSAKNGFYDPFWEEATANNTYGYCGEEFRSHEQVASIKKAYASKRRQLKKQFVLTFILSVLILFLEHLPLIPLTIPYVSEWMDLPVFYYALAVLFSALLVLVSLKTVWRGIRSLALLRAEPAVSLACLAILNFLYSIFIFLFAKQGGFPVYNFAIAIFLLLGIADDGMRLTREKLAFDVVSESKTKLSLERFEGNAETKLTSAASSKKDFFVEKIDVVGNFFTRFGRKPAQFSEYFYELTFSTLGALLVSLVSLYLGHDIVSAFTLFVFSALVCLPMQFLILGIYPFFHLTKGLSKLDSVVIGDAITDEYGNADTIYLEDTEMFGKHGARVVGLRVYNDMDFYEILSYALSVFSIVGAPLCNVFDNSAREIEKKDGVKITNISVGGLEASVENEKKIYIGNLAFMRSRGYFPKRNPDDEKKIESGQISILYMAIGGELCAKIYMQYTVTQRFEKFAAEMIRNGIRVGIRTLDPNVNEKMIAALRNDDTVSIKVIRPTPNELIPLGKHSDSGIVTSKNSHMIFKILEQCFNIKRIHAGQRKIRVGALLLGLAVSVLFMIFKLYIKVPSLYIVVYQLLWLIPAFIYTKSKLK